MGDAGCHDLPRIHCSDILPSQFYDEYIKRARPVILCGAMDAWPAYPLWTLDTLAARFGYVGVSVDRGDGGRAGCTLAEYVTFVRSFSVSKQLDGAASLKGEGAVLKQSVPVAFVRNVSEQGGEAVPLECVQEQGDNAVSSQQAGRGALLHRVEQEEGLCLQPRAEDAEQGCTETEALARNTIATYGDHPAVRSGACGRSDDHGAAAQTRQQPPLRDDVGAPACERESRASRLLVVEPIADSERPILCRGDEARKDAGMAGGAPDAGLAKGKGAIGDATKAESNGATATCRDVASIRESFSASACLDDSATSVCQDDNEKNDNPAKHKAKVVPYLRTWNFGDDCPELLDEFRGEPYFPDQFKKLGADMQPPFTWMFVGPPGVATRLHVDIWETDAWLAQFEGRKRFTLFHPAHLAFVSRQREDGQLAFVDPTNPDLQAFPDFPRAIPVTATLHPGEIIYLPRRWPHHVAGIDATLSLTSNFLSPPNKLRLMGTLGAYMARRRQCQELLGRPLRAKDNLMKFCVHGGKIDVAAAEAVMGKALSLLGTPHPDPDLEEVVQDAGKPQIIQ